MFAVATRHARVLALSYADCREPVIKDHKVLSRFKREAFVYPPLLFTAASKYAIRLVELARKRLIGYLDVTGIRNLHYISKT